MADNKETVGRGQLSVAGSEIDGITVLGLRGEVDYQSVGALTRAMPAPDPADGRRVVVDMSGVTFMDSSGVNALIAAHQAMQGPQGWLRLAGVRGAVLRTVQLVGLDTLVSCHATVEDAIAA
ncbi:STAS domain-containing protein [Streptomyces sp. NPDC101225]|uniref:STAS domain-containing protein n=1 Tax=Streptomyces sp. NPDC101225 TaxID=3366135 RepID=UPI003822EBA6